MRQNWLVRLAITVVALLLAVPVFSQETAGYRVVIPVAGNAAGANGTFFKSTVTLLNTGFRDGVTPPRSQRVRVDFYPRNASADLGAPIFVTLSGFLGHWENFLADAYSPARGGLGALVFTAVDDNGAPQTDALLFAVSRIFTAQASTTNCVNPNGEVSQSLESVPVEDIASFTQKGWINGLRHDSRFRTNLGIVNHSESDEEFTITLYPFNGGEPISYDVSVPAKALIHEPVLAGDYGSSLIVSVQAKRAGFFFSAYGSTVDNNTGDGWTFRATR